MQFGNSIISINEYGAANLHKLNYRDLQLIRELSDSIEELSNQLKSALIEFESSLIE